MFLFFLLWNVVLCNEATQLLPFVGINLSERDDNSKRNINSVSSSSYNSTPQTPPIIIKRKRNLPGNPDPNAEVIALAPETLLATNRFVCEICQKGFQREQNLQLHRRGHNLPWKLKQRNSSENRKKVYTCPEPTCVHHHPSRALGDLTGIKKHFSRKHGEKRWRCEKCSKIYAVHSDWKAHSKTCGTREYRCDCGTNFSRKDSFTTHRAFCSALAQESARISATYTLSHQAPPPPPSRHQTLPPLFSFPPPPHHQNHIFSPNPTPMWDPPTQNPTPLYIKPETLPSFDLVPPRSLSTTRDHVGSSMASSNIPSHLMGRFGSQEGHLTRDFLGLTREECVRASLHTSDTNMGLKELLTFNGMARDDHDLMEMKGQSTGAGFGFGADPIWK